MDNLNRPIKTIGVIGMGYVGIPNALLFANDPDTDFVYGIQRESPRSAHKIKDLNKGTIPFTTYEDVMDPLLQRAIDDSKFTCTSDYSVIEDCDAVIISVQTPFKNKTEPDYDAIMSAIDNTALNMKKGALISIESTITPGFTKNFIAAEIALVSDLIPTQDFLLVHAPERVTPGKMSNNIRNIDRVVGGSDPVSTKVAANVYKRIVTGANIIETDSTTAETIKTAENTFRDLQIAAINQLALYCETLGVNVYDVRRGIDSLEGYGVTRSVLWPGAGVGGHCLTKDTYHLERGVKISDNATDYPSHTDSLYCVSRDINDYMPIHMFNLAKSALSSVKKWIYDCNIAVMGLSYNHDSDDMRNTPTEKFCSIFGKQNENIRIHDPYVDRYEGDYFISSVFEEVLHKADVILIFTGHKEYYYLNPLNVKSSTGNDHPVIVDGRNVIDPDNFINCGFVYRGIGRGDKNNHPIIHCGDNK